MKDSFAPGRTDFVSERKGNQKGQYPMLTSLAILTVTAGFTEKEIFNYRSYGR